MARRHLLSFTTESYPKYRPARQHILLAEALERVARGDLRRLMVFMPPRHGKSELVSIRFPAWFLGRYPDRRVILASYGGSLAVSFSRQIRNLVNRDVYRSIFPMIRLATDSRSADAWNLEGQQGGLTAVGIGSGITGRGAHLFILDDPVKSVEEAESITSRQSTWDWYTHEAYTRLEEGGAIVLVMTRWHTDDLAGRLLAAEQAGGDHWEVIKLPAIDATGAALWPEKFSVSDLTQIRAAIGSRAYSALYNQEPQSPEGGMFKRSWFVISQAAPAEAARVRYWDKAGSAGTGDYSVGVRMARSAQGIFYVEDVQRGQWSNLERNRLMRQTAELDGQEVDIWCEQEPGSGGKESAELTVRLLAGFNVHVEPVTGDKQYRAGPYAAQAEAGNVHLVTAAWNASYIQELADFPFGGHNDQVDASSGAFNKLAANAGRSSGGIFV